MNTYLLRLIVPWHCQSMAPPHSSGSCQTVLVRIVRMEVVIHHTCLCGLYCHQCVCGALY